jgi:photosystem I P700 chlorophyll a apoprotein A1
MRLFIIHTPYVVGGFCVVGGAAHAAIFMVRDYTPANNYNNLLDRVLRHVIQLCI